MRDCLAHPRWRLPSGYDITVSKTGFVNWEAKGFTVNVGQTLDFKVDLAVSGAATTKVDVTAEAPLIEDTKSGVTATVGTDRLTTCRSTAAAWTASCC